MALHEREKRSQEGKSDNKVYFFQHFHFFHAPEKETKEKWLLRVFPFLCILFRTSSSMRWILLFRFPFTILAQSVSTHILCKIHFNVFNFFTSRAHNVAKKAIWTRSIHLWAEQTSRVCSAHSHSHSERASTFIYICSFVACSIVITPFFLHL